MAGEPGAPELQEAATAGDRTPAGDELPTIDRVAQVILGGAATEHTAASTSGEEMLDPIGRFGTSLGQY